MGKKSVYIFLFSNPQIIGGGIRGGDNLMKLFQETLEEQGVDCICQKGITPDIKHILLADFVVFPRADSKSLKGICDLCDSFKKKYIFFPFHEQRQWQADALVFLQQALKQTSGIATLLSDEVFTQRLLYVRNATIQSRPAYENALFNIVNSKQEALEIKKDYPSATTKEVRLSCGVVKGIDEIDTNIFLKHTGLKKGEYILQVGRVELRKNQIASAICAMRLQIPLVLIFTEYNQEYLNMLIQISKGYSMLAPIFLLTPLKITFAARNIRVIQSDVSNELLISAYQNAGLHLHPSYYECPGYTYLEAAKLAIPTVASSRSTLREYLFDENEDFAFDEGIDFVRPDDIETMTKSARTMFGKKFKRPDLQIFKRTDKDIKDEMSVLINQYML